MRKTAWLAIPLSLAILFSACSKAAEKEREDDYKKPETEPAAPVQQEMTQEQLDAAIYDTELQLIAAALETESQYNAVGTPENFYKAALADLDGDGKQELIGTLHALSFDPDDRGKVGMIYSQSGIRYLTDKDGNLYEKEGIGEFFNETVDGKLVEYSGSADIYHCPTGGPTIRVVDCQGMCDGQQVDPWQKVTIGDDTYEWEEGQKKLEEMGLTEITTHPGDFTTATYEAIYTDSLVAGLDSYFANMYPAHGGKFTADIDGDGLEETGFVIPDLMEDWLAPYQETLPGEDGMINWLVNAQFAYQTDYTGFLLVDPGQEQVTVRSGCTRGILRPAGDSLTYESYILSCGSAQCYLPAPGQALTDYSSAIMLMLDGDTYHDFFMKQVDLADIPGTELLCIAQQTRTSDSWNVIVYALQDGVPVSIYRNSIYNSSLFVSAYDGVPALLTYKQTFNNSGNYRTSYSYRLLRFDTNGAETELDSHSVSYTTDESDGTEAAAFFAKLEPYLQKLTVICDPFKLTGQQWLSPEEADAGTPPEEPKSETPDGETEPESTEATLGFVQVESEKSWLHLRTGPGTNYDKVLTNPDDPNSFVRQALGSPVTILETIETDDPANPVWVKIRITYQDTEIVGYSSKTYIRIP